MTKIQTKGIEEILGSSESEGAIQDLFLNQEIRIVNAVVKQGKQSEFVLIDLVDKDGNNRKCHSSANAIVDNIKSLLQTEGFGKNLEVTCRCIWVKSANDNEYLKLDKV
jgi:hypothetical protein